MLSTEPHQLTPREFALMEAETTESQLNREHAIRVKELELAVQKDYNETTIKLKELELKWRSLLKLPLLLVLLPLLVLFGMAYICSMFTKKEMPRAFWQLFQ